MTIPAGSAGKTPRSRASVHTRRRVVGNSVASLLEADGVELLVPPPGWVPAWARPMTRNPMWRVSERPFSQKGTEGSNPAPSSGESVLVVYPRAAGEKTPHFSGLPIGTGPFKFEQMRADLTATRLYLQILPRLRRRIHAHPAS
jgi:hypothetical protein